MEEAPLLLAVDRVVGGVDVQHDHLRWLVVCVHEDIDEERLEGIIAVANLLVPFLRGMLLGRQLQAVEGAATGSAVARVSTPFSLLSHRVLLARCEGQKRVVSETVVFIEILVAANDPEDALGHQLANGVLDAVGIAVVVEAGRDAIKEVDSFGNLAGEEDACVGRRTLGPEIGYDSTGSEAFKLELGAGTLCHVASVLVLAEILCGNKTLPQEADVDFPPGEFSGLDTNIVPVRGLQFKPSQLGLNVGISRGSGFTRHTWGSNVSENTSRELR